jgi:hypothetical protein
MQLLISNYYFFSAANNFFIKNYKEIIARWIWSILPNLNASISF